MVSHFSSLWNTINFRLSYWRASSPLLHRLYCTSPNDCLRHPSLTCQDILRLISVRRRNRASAAQREMSLCLKLVCEFTAASLWGQWVRRGRARLVCWRRWVRAGVITHCPSPSKKHGEGGLCLPHCEGKGVGRRGADSSAEGGWWWNAAYF